MDRELCSQVGLTTGIQNSGQVPQVGIVAFGGAAPGWHYKPHTLGSDRGKDNFRFLTQPSVSFAA